MKCPVLGKDIKAEEILNSNDYDNEFIQVGHYLMSGLAYKDIVKKPTKTISHEEADKDLEESWNYFQEHFRGK